MNSTVLGTVQPAYLAWIPFFRRMQMSDVFVYLDDVEYSKNSFHNRNRIKGKNGAITLTVPVRYKGASKKYINEVMIADYEKWNKKHWKSIKMNYGQSPYFDELEPLLEKIYTGNWDTLGDLNIALIDLFKDYLGIATPCYRSSELNIEGQGNEKLVNMCRKLGAGKFVVKPGTEDYHPGEYFRNHGIEFEYFTYEDVQYLQLYGEYIRGLSILDYAMNCGSKSF